MKSNASYTLRSTGISYTRTREVVLHAFSQLGYSTKVFGLHSLRSGGATAAANAGVNDRLFKRHGRWRSDKAKDDFVISFKKFRDLISLFFQFSVLFLYFIDTLDSLGINKRDAYS